MRVALVLGCLAVAGYVRADPRRGVAVGELLREIGEEFGSAAAITALTVAYTRERLTTAAEMRQLTALLNECAVLPLAAVDALALGEIANRIAGDKQAASSMPLDGALWSRAHDVLAARNHGAPLLSAGSFYARLFPGLDVIDMDND